MQPPLNEETRAFWQVIHTKKREYPYWCKTPTHTPAPSLVKAGKHVRVTQGDDAYWGFRDIDHRDDFKHRYKAEDWKP